MSQVTDTPEVTDVGDGPIAPLTLAESARRVVGWANAEFALYETVGSWVVGTPDPGAKIYFDSCSQHHAWRAAAWKDHTAAGWTAKTGIGETAAGGADEGGGLMAHLRGAEGTIPRLAAYCRIVLPYTLIAYRSWRAGCSSSADRPVARTLDRALADVEADWQDGEQILEGLLRTREEVLGASRAVGEAECLLVGKGLVSDG